MQKNGLCASLGVLGRIKYNRLQVRQLARTRSWAPEPEYGFTGSCVFFEEIAIDLLQARFPIADHRGVAVSVIPLSRGGTFSG